MKKMLVLYRELAGYFVTCINHLSAVHQVSVDIVAWPVHPDAPFQFRFSPGVRVIDRHACTAADLSAMIRAGNYDLIFCGGWSDPDYLDVICRHPEVPALLGFDKQWRAGFRDFLAAFYLKWKVTPHFRSAFVPGEEQHAFARRMGFRDEQITEGAYACDHPSYEAVFAERRRRVPLARLRKIWFAGRYVPEKAVNEFFATVVPLLDGPLQDWELHCAGTGPLWEQRPIHPRIVHHGFVQSSDMPALISDGEIFVLPSRFEPWGLVVQEFALAGYALILSDAVGARTSFLEEGRNGHVFRSGDWKQLEIALRSLASHSREDLLQMGEYSHQLAGRISPETWSQSLLQRMR